MFIIDLHSIKFCTQLTLLLGSGGSYSENKQKDFHHCFIKNTN